MTTYLSEVFPLQYQNLQYACFKVSPEIDREVGNQLSWWLSNSNRQTDSVFKHIVVEYDRGNFWILAPSTQSIPSDEQWQIRFNEIQQEKQEDLGDCFFSIQRLNREITAEILSRLAVKALKIARAFPSQTIFDQDQIKVKRECNFFPITVEINRQTQSAIMLTSRSSIVPQLDLVKFIEKQSDSDLSKNLIGLQVKEIEKNSGAKIIEIVGTVEEYRTYLLKKKPSKIIRDKIETAPEDQLVVAVQFGKNKKPYYYLLSALRPSLSPKTAAALGVNYEIYKNKTLISYAERKQLLITRKQQAEQCLKLYGISLENECINSRNYEKSFYKPQVNLDDTPLLFGKNYVGKRGKTLTGLRKGGVYKRHDDFSNPAMHIGGAILNFTSLKCKTLIDQLTARLKLYGFEFSCARELTQSISLEGLSSAQAKAKAEESVNKVLTLEPHIVLVFLPESDSFAGGKPQRQKDDSDGDSLYCWVSSRLRRREVASQVIYEDNLRQRSKYKDILNSVVPGILGKLGNIPFVLAEPIPIANLIVGLDISRRPKKNLPGSVNACASVRLYGNNGEFFGYRVFGNSAIEGEEIPQRILDDFLPQADIQGKTVLVYRDGKFRGKEIEHLLARAAANGAKFVLVECVKSDNPLLYSLNNGQLQQPPKGLALCLSPSEAVLITTQVSPKVGTPNPIRLKIKPQGEQASIESLINATLKLTLLHYGSLKDPRLPIPLFGADRIAYRRLQGIIPVVEGDKQYWL